MIHRAPDCAITCVEGTYRTVLLSPPVTLPDHEKLETLRRLDQFRQWGSLDDKRYCLVCGKIITGREIPLTGGTRGNGALRVSCPTERCNSIPMDWVLPTEEIIARVELMAAEERKASLLRTPARPDGVARRAEHAHGSIATRLRNLAWPFNRHA